MTIDLRYIIPFVAFYVPGSMVAIGGWLIGFSLDEMRFFVAIFGLGFGVVFFGLVFSFISKIPPIRVAIFKGAGE